MQFKQLERSRPESLAFGAGVDRTDLANAILVASHTVESRNLLCRSSTGNALTLPKIPLVPAEMPPENLFSHDLSTVHPLPEFLPGARQVPTLDRSQHRGRAAAFCSDHALRRQEC